MSSKCPWCGYETLQPTHTKGRYECTYCGLMCLVGFKNVPAEEPKTPLVPDARKRD